MEEDGITEDIRHYQSTQANNLEDYYSKIYKELFHLVFYEKHFINLLVDENSDTHA